MKQFENNNIPLISAEEQFRRIQTILEEMQRHNVAAAIVSDISNIYYLTGRIFSGYILINPAGECFYYVKRPNNLTGENLFFIHKPEMMGSHIEGLPKGQIALELDALSYSSAERLHRIFPERDIFNISPALRLARSVKTKVEIDKIIRSGELQTEVYRRIPGLFRAGMTDIDFQLRIEFALRQAGCLGQFRIGGDSMELFMGNIIAGDNADTPSPYDFAMGGAGADPSLPVGGDGTKIMPGMAVMVDANGNFTGYMTDMTRTFYYGELSETARKAHECSIEICRTLARMGKPGLEAKTMYETALEIAREKGLEDFFMGHRQKAGFVGHGVGIEINELPVIAPRSRDKLKVGNVIALEPKFVIPGVGAVGIENTYILYEDGFKCVTLAPEELLPL